MRLLRQAFKDPLGKSLVLKYFSIRIKSEWNKPFTDRRGVKIKEERNKAETNSTWAVRGDGTQLHGSSREVIESSEVQEGSFKYKLEEE